MLHNCITMHGTKCVKPALSYTT